MNLENKDFWLLLDKLVKESEIIIDRPKGSTHPRYPDFIYQVDYGYLKGTFSQDGDGIDIWVGSNLKKEIDAIICIVDYVNRDSEIKVLYGCNDREKEIIYKTHNQTKFMKGIMINR